MQSIILVAVIAGVLLATFAVPQAQAATQLTMPSTGVTPDNKLFYFFKRLGEDFDLYMTADPEARSVKQLYYAEVRVAEAIAMINKGEPDAVPELMQDYNKRMNEVSQVIPNARNGTAQAVNSAVLKEVLEKHNAALLTVLASAPDAAKPSIATVVSDSVVRVNNIVSFIESKPEIKGEFKQAEIDVEQRGLSAYALSRNSFTAE